MVAEAGELVISSSTTAEVAVAAAVDLPVALAAPADLQDKVTPVEQGPQVPYLRPVVEVLPQIPEPMAAVEAA